jgi:hypothetical protein
MFTSRTVTVSRFLKGNLTLRDGEIVVNNNVQDAAAQVPQRDVGPNAIKHHYTDIPA